MHYRTKPHRYLAILSLLLGCGGGDSGGSTHVNFTAVIDGKDWQAAPISIAAQVNAGVKGSLLLVGTQTVDGKSQ